MEKSAMNAVSDTARGASLIRAVGALHGNGSHNQQHLMERAYQALAKINPKGWTRRRVRALWNKEVARVDLREGLEMTQAIEDAKRLERERKNHAAFIEETARIERLAALLATTDEAFHCEQIEAHRKAVRRVDRAGTEGD